MHHPCSHWLYHLRGETESYYQQSQHGNMCCASSLSGVQLFATPGTAAHQAPLSMGILQARILERLATPFSRESSQPRDRTQGLWHCKWILYQLSHQGSPRGVTDAVISRMRRETSDMFGESQGRLPGESNLLAGTSRKTGGEPKKGR